MNYTLENVGKQVQFANIMNNCILELFNNKIIVVTVHDSIVVYNDFEKALLIIKKYFPESDFAEKI